jgi:hypothetical protein
MKTKSKDIGAKKELTKFDYFKYFEENKEDMKPISHQQFIETILKSRAEKLKQSIS